MNGKKSYRKCSLLCSSVNYNSQCWIKLVNIFHHSLQMKHIKYSMNHIALSNQNHFTRIIIMSSELLNRNVPGGPEGSINSERWPRVPRPASDASPPSLLAVTCTQEHKLRWTELNTLQNHSTWLQRTNQFLCFLFHPSSWSTAREVSLFPERAGGLHYTQTHDDDRHRLDFWNV